MRADPNDYSTAYYYGRMLQTTGKLTEGSIMLQKAESMINDELRLHPKNAKAMIYLALTQTRLGKFTEATLLAKKVLEVGSNDPHLLYLVAQLYSLQMYSPEKKKIDTEKRDEAVKTLRRAMEIRFQYDELTNADFYNMYEQTDFRTLIAQSTSKEHTVSQ
jgi:tetratricopeptide (TPR) repeat protein